MPLNDLHRRVATIALRAANRYGFALGGGNALIAHGLIDRPTQDVDLFTNEEDGVVAAAASVETALQRAGFAAEREGRPPNWRTSSPASATGWPSGRSPRPTASARCCRWRTSTGPRSR